MIHPIAHLDVPTFRSIHGLRMLQDIDLAFQYWADSVAWRIIERSTNLAMMLIRLLFPLLVLLTVMWEQQDGPLLVVLSFLQHILPRNSTGQAVVRSSGRSTADILSHRLSQKHSLGRVSDQ
jgi:hypothetical protein